MSPLVSPLNIYNRYPYGGYVFIFTSFLFRPGRSDKEFRVIWARPDPFQKVSGTELRILKFFDIDAAAAGTLY